MKRAELEAEVRALRQGHALHARQLLGIEHELRQQRIALDTLGKRIEAGWSIDLDDRAKVQEAQRGVERLTQRLDVMEAQ